MLLSTPTRVPAPPVIPTRVPAPVSTPVLTSSSVSVPTVVPSPPVIPTERPYMYGLKQVAASQAVAVLSVAGVKLLVSDGQSVAFPSWGSAAVSGAALLRAALARSVSGSAVVSASGLVGVGTRGSSSASVSGTATVRPAYTRTASGTAAVSASAATAVTYTLAASNGATVTGTAALNALSYYLRDDFNGTALDSGWTSKNGTWTVSGGLAAPANVNNSYIVRSIPGGTATTSGLTTVCEVQATVVDNAATFGVGAMVFTTTANDVTASIGIYVRGGGWVVRINNNDVTQATVSTSLRSRVEVQGVNARFYVDNSLVYTYTASTPIAVNGFGAYSNAATPNNRVDWVEARVR